MVEMICCLWFLGYFSDRTVHQASVLSDWSWKSVTLLSFCDFVQLLINICLSLSLHVLLSESIPCSDPFVFILTLKQRLNRLNRWLSFEINPWNDLLHRNLLINIFWLHKSKETSVYLLPYFSKFWFLNKRFLIFRTTFWDFILRIVYNRRSDSFNL
jgi:hypothetical protein